MTTAKKIITGFCFLGLLLGLSACKKPVQQAQFYIFGTLVDITLADIEKERADKIFAEVQQQLQQMHNDWHPWEPGMLVDINRAFAQGICAPLDEKTRQLIIASQQMEKETDGKFNAGIGGFIDLWGFHTSEFPIHASPPAATAISRLVALRPSSLSIYFEGDKVCSNNPATQLDFGGIAKGFAVDRVVEKLKTMGVDASIVNAGGDLRAYTRVDHQLWRIAVRHPKRGLIGLIQVTADEAVFTSGNYQRYVENQGQRYAHIIDPHSGWPVADVASVTVLTNNGTQADAAATALMVAGLDDWPELARHLHLDAVLVVDEQGKLYMTPAMQARINLYEPEDESKTGSDNKVAEEIKLKPGEQFKANARDKKKSQWEVEIIE